MDSLATVIAGKISNGDTGSLAAYFLILALLGGLVVYFSSLLGKLGEKSGERILEMFRRDSVVLRLKILAINILWIGVGLIMRDLDRRTGDILEQTYNTNPSADAVYSLVVLGIWRTAGYVAWGYIFGRLNVRAIKVWRKIDVAVPA